MREELGRQIQKIIADELTAAKMVYPANNSRHESIAVLVEEYEELRDEVKHLEYIIHALWIDTKENTNTEEVKGRLTYAQRTAADLIAEAVQTAAMIDKFLEYENSKIAPVQPQPFALTNRVWTEEQKRDIALIKEAHKAKRLTKKMNSDTMGKTRKETKSKAKSNKRTDIDDTLIVYMRDVQKRTIKQIAKEINAVRRQFLTDTTGQSEMPRREAKHERNEMSKLRESNTNRNMRQPRQTKNSRKVSNEKMFGVRP